jgi:hypothetical protein
VNDQDLMTKVAEPFTGLRMTTPLETIAGRGRALRRRRRLPVLAGTVAAAAAAITLAISALLPATGPVPATLAAWTVTRAPDGTVTVTVRELRDPAGLQATLRADGVPASVWYVDRPNPACRVPTVPVGGALDRVYSFPASAQRQDVIVIHPAALPPGTGVALGAMWQHPGQPRQPGTMITLETGLVSTSKQCTGP